MSTLQQLREDVNQSWENLLQGWRQLSDRASGALTRFIPAKRDDEHGNQNDISRQSSGWGLMAAEVFDDEDRIIVKLEAPGMEAEDFDIQVRGDLLIVRGEKRFQREQSKGHYHLRECAYGRFERAITLPGEVDDDRAEASYKRGLLNITLPKIRQQAGRRIKIGTS